MKLADWLHKQRLTPEQLRRMLGVKNRSTVTRYLSGDRRPSVSVLQKIHDITRGEVTLTDFLDTSPPKCAAVIMSPEGEPKLVFPWSNNPADLQAAFDQLSEAPAEGSTLSDAVTLAMETLGNRVKLTVRGKFLLDGRVTDARRVVRAANEVREADGRAPIPYPTVKRRPDDA